MGTGGWVYRVLPSRSQIPVYWYCQGPTIARTGIYRVPRHSGPYLGPPHTWLPHPYLRTRFSLNILKLVNNPECHRNSLMRPVILPISKTGLKCHDLEFSGFRYPQPSLTRNKWSYLEAGASLWSKRQSVTRIVYFRGRSIPPRTGHCPARSSLTLQHASMGVDSAPLYI